MKLKITQPRKELNTTEKTKELTKALREVFFNQYNGNISHKQAISLARTASVYLRSLHTEILIESVQHELQIKDRVKKIA